MSRAPSYTDLALPTETVRVDGSTWLDVEAFGLTDTGLKRSNNEDQFFIGKLQKAIEVIDTSLTTMPAKLKSPFSGNLFIVADGMGGHEGGEVASSLAVHVVECYILNTLKWFYTKALAEETELGAQLIEAVEQANASILKHATQSGLTGMGTTITLGLRITDHLYVAHVGDSRGYILRDGKLYRLTRDHTIAAELSRMGEISREDAEKHPMRHVLTNVVGGQSHSLKVEIVKVWLNPDDRLIFCSDGLTDLVADPIIEQTVRDAASPEQACRMLVDLANQAGGKDNITVIVAQTSLQPISQTQLMGGSN